MNNYPRLFSNKREYCFICGLRQKNHKKLWSNSGWSSSTPNITVTLRVWRFPFQQWCLKRFNEKQIRECKTNKTKLSPPPATSELRTCWVLVLVVPYSYRLPSTCLPLAPPPPPFIPSGALLKQILERKRPIRPWSDGGRWLTDVWLPGLGQNRRLEGSERVLQRLRSQFPPVFAMRPHRCKYRC